MFRHHQQQQITKNGEVPEHVRIFMTRSTNFWGEKDQIFRLKDPDLGFFLVFLRPPTRLIKNLNCLVDIILNFMKSIRVNVICFFVSLFATSELACVGSLLIHAGFFSLLGNLLCHPQLTIAFLRLLEILERFRWLSNLVFPDRTDETILIASKFENGNTNDTIDVWPEYGFLSNSHVTLV